MRKFKALLKKDWQIHKKTILIPFWIVGGFYLINVIIMLSAYFTGHFETSFYNTTEGISADMVSFFANYVIVVFPGILVLLFVIISTQSSLNEDKRIKCELFHRSQPASIWQRTGSKYVVGIFANLGIFIIISIINFVVLNIILTFINQFEFSAAVQGLIQSQLVYIKSAIVIGSIAFFMSSIFDQSAFMKFVAILVAVNIIIVILNAIYNWNIPSPMKYLIALIKNSPKFHNDISIIEINFAEVIRDNWSDVFWNLKTIWQMLISGALFAGGTYLYGRKEIS